MKVNMSSIDELDPHVVETVKTSLIDAGYVLLPPGDSTREEFAVFVGREDDPDIWAHANNLEQGKEYLAWAIVEKRWHNPRLVSRRVTVWMNDGPNDYWQRFVTAWEAIEEEN